MVSVLRPIGVVVAKPFEVNHSKTSSKNYQFF